MNGHTTRRVEEKMANLFSEKTQFSENLFKWEDNSLPDKYDHNCFEYMDQPTIEEFQNAADYQREKGDTFIKLEGDHPLTDSFGLEPGVTLTMVLKADSREWKRNEKVRFAVPALEELEEIEVKHYGSVYGESFSRRNIHRLYEKLDYHGAYIGDKLVAACYSFSSYGMTCIDGLIVGEEHRHQGIATALLAHIAETNENSTLFLHADEDDTVKYMYLKLGFEVTDHLYEYSRTDMFYTADRSEWRKCLMKHFETASEIWFVFPMKGSGEESLSYNDAVEEALCFGWIDSTNKRIDELHCARRFTPRKPGSAYSQPNIERLIWLDGQGMIHPKVRGSILPLIQTPFIFPEDIIEAIRQNEEVWANYQNFSEPYKRIRIAYIDAARKRPEEFQRRLNNFIEKTRRNKLIIGYGGVNKYYK